MPTVLGATKSCGFWNPFRVLKARVALTTTYAAGLRVSEVAVLKVSDIDSSRTAFENYEAIVDAACDAWRNLIADPDRITSIGMRDWAHVGHPL